MTRLNSPWLSLPALQNLFGLFEKEGATLRLVGGSVRDGILGLPVDDIDLAVDRDPNWVLSFLKDHYIQAIPTGIDHGTVTAILDKRPYQITTLRVDVKTFGRKAQVAFTEDWLQDAYRRDFTMNAIYADRHGHLFDPVGGLHDLKNHRVRFIGDADQRLQEDYLRILRFFRFSARYGHEPYDEKGLQACTRYASYIPHLARERVTEEFLKLLKFPSPLYALEAMGRTGVLTYILHPYGWAVIKALIALEKRTEYPPSSLLRLAAFHPNVKEIKAHLRLSNSQQKTLTFLLDQHPFITKASFKGQAYYFRKEPFLELAFFQTAHRIAASEISLEEGANFFIELRQAFDSWKVPVFPLSGHDILEKNVQSGKQIGVLLEIVEKWWVSKDLTPDRKACLDYLSTFLKNRK